MNNKQLKKMSKVFECSLNIKFDNETYDRDYKLIKDTIICYVDIKNSFSYTLYIHKNKLNTLKTYLDKMDNNVIALYEWSNINIYPKSQYNKLNNIRFIESSIGSNGIIKGSALTPIESEYFLISVIDRLENYN